MATKEELAFSIEHEEALPAELTPMQQALEKSRLAMARKERDARIAQTREELKTDLVEKTSELLNAMTRDKICDASMRELSQAFGVIYDRMRLENGESTANINVNMLSGMIASISDQSLEVEAEVLPANGDKVESSGHSED